MCFNRWHLSYLICTVSFAAYFAFIFLKTVLKCLIYSVSKIGVVAKNLLQDGRQKKGFGVSRVQGNKAIQSRRHMLNIFYEEICTHAPLAIRRRLGSSVSVFKCVTNDWDIYHRSEREKE